MSSIKHPVIEEWRILFLIEGLPSLVLGILAFFFLPGRPQTTRFLSESQRELILGKLEGDSLGEAKDGVDWKGVQRALSDWRCYVTALMCESDFVYARQGGN